MSGGPTEPQSKPFSFKIQTGFLIPRQCPPPKKEEKYFFSPTSNQTTYSLGVSGFFKLLKVSSDSILSL